MLEVYIWGGFRKSEISFANGFICVQNVIRGVKLGRNPLFLFFTSLYSHVITIIS